MNKKTVFVVFRNADFTEGRGPMLVHSIYDSLELAQRYVMRCDGIFGSTQSLDPIRFNDDDLEIQYANGYLIREFVVRDALPLSRAEQAAMRTAALAKLTPEEIELLGIKEK